MKELKVINSPSSINMYNYVADMQGCGHIRMIFPSLLLNHLRYNRYRFYASYGNVFINDINFYKNFSIIVFQRAATENHFNLINHFMTNIKSHVKVPIVYEIDDLLIDIPHWNRAHVYYNKHMEPIKKIMNLVNGITVSTNKLKDIYSEFNKNIVVIPNHLPKFLWGDDVTCKVREISKNEKPRILYQGSDNHFCTKKMFDETGLNGGDFGNDLLSFIKKTIDKYQWIFMGGFPLELKSLIDNGKIEYHKWQSIFEYPKYIKNIKPDLCLAPLQKNIFNECKSNIKNLEYVALGVPSVYTNIEPYKNTILKSNTDEEMISHIEKIITDPDLSKDVWEKDYEVVKGQLFWENDDNIVKYINSHLSLFNRRLENKINV